MPSWIVKLLAAVFAVSAAIFLVLKYSPPIPISSVVTQKTDLFTVSGEGTVTVIPDTGLLNVGISLSRPNVKSAQSEVNAIINTVSAETKKLGVDAKDIKTRNYSVNPEYDYSAGARKITGYRVSTSLTIKVRELDKINDVIDVATANGANTVSGIQLTVDDDRQKELLQQAREQAIKEAKTKAESLAHAAGISLGRIVNIQESGTPYRYDQMYAALRYDVVDSGKTNIEPGSTDITASVTLFYETR